MQQRTIAYMADLASVSEEDGFTMVEMAVAVLILGLLFALSVPAIQSMSQSYRLKGATENVASIIRLYRDRAINTGQPQHFHFSPAVGKRPDMAATQLWDYMVYPPTHNANMLVGCWRLPRGITFSGGTLGWNEMLPNGRSLFSGDIVLQDPRGNRDTVSVQLSGLVITK